MVLASLQDTFGLLTKYPAFWAAGIVAGAALGIDLFLEFSGEVFFAGKILLLGLLLVPFFAAGAYGTAHREDRSMAVFLEEGKKGYFRVLLPGIVLFLATVVTVFLLAIPITLVLGENAIAMAGSAVFGVILSFAFFAYFYDVAAVTEELGVFVSLQRSAAVVLTRLWQVLLFYLVNLFALFILGFGVLIVWSMLVYEKLAPLVESGETFAFDAANATATQAQFITLLGPDGAMITAITYAVFIVLVLPFTLAFKAAFYARHADGTVEEPIVEVGEYDEKGRWYKY
ncbi:hypothetical protein RJ40_10585 [Methanofollis aquaemaris]|uniref:DUF7847 domain-containing protein n=1 Tax=Methanofollis aquaemaris TaxID=126734 RepID=A0A8A3S700_9EURY|nr:hypothetical protein [Methanofollis aquaemaris]QSZ67908.1 hypothetical protein RJ40_10585 [Methanofollis aquaemaris]